MSNYFLTFDIQVQRDFTRLIEDVAPAIWGEAESEYGNIRIAAGNYSGYGRYVARCWESGLIEIPTGNTKSGLSMMKIRNGVVCYETGKRQQVLRMHGVLLHEIGHHVTNHARRKPWKHLKAGYSTHTNPAWCWIAATGWKHFHPEWEGSPEALAAMVRARLGSKAHDLGEFAETMPIGKILAGFDPYNEPPELQPGLAVVPTEPGQVCGLCGTKFIPSRSDARYCSAKCRKQAWKERQESVVEEQTRSGDVA